MKGWPRYIIHVDMDAFYAAVEQRDNPELIGKPVVIGGRPNSRGVVSTASYEARCYGIRSAMPLAEAYRLCPHAAFLNGSHSKYHQVSRQIMSIYERYTPEIEPLSLDEAFLEVTGSVKIFGGAESIGRAIKESIQSELQLTASVGISYNKYLAKLASDLQKPNGFCIISPDEAEGILEKLPISRLWGVGAKTAAQLKAIGLNTIGQVRRVPVDLLEKHVGSLADHLYQLSRGIDHRSVESGHQVKSVGNEITFDRDLLAGEIPPFLLELSLQVGRRLRKGKLAGKTITLKLRFADFKTITRSQTLSAPIDADQEIYEHICKLYQANLPKARLRLVGVTLSNLAPKERDQALLFTDRRQEKLDRLNITVDKICDKFGRTCVTRGTLIDHE